MTGKALVLKAAAMLKLGLPGADELAQRGLDLATKQLGAQHIEVIELGEEWKQYRTSTPAAPPGGEVPDSGP